MSSELKSKLKTPMSTGKTTKHLQKKSCKRVVCRHYENRRDDSKSSVDDLVSGLSSLIHDINGTRVKTCEAWTQTCLSSDECSGSVRERTIYDIHNDAVYSFLNQLLKVQNSINGLSPITIKGTSALRLFIRNTYPEEANNYYAFVDKEGNMLSDIDIVVYSQTFIGLMRYLESFGKLTLISNSSFNSGSIITKHKGIIAIAKYQLQMNPETHINVSRMGFAKLIKFDIDICTVKMNRCNISLCITHTHRLLYIMNNNNMSINANCCNYLQISIILVWWNY